MSQYEFRLTTDVLLQFRDTLSAAGQSRTLLNLCLACRAFHELFEPGLVCDTLTLRASNVKRVLASLRRSQCA